MNALKLAYTLVTIACSQDLVKNSECAVACKWAGYDDGCYRDNRCFCVELKDYKTMTDVKRLKIPVMKRE